MIKMMQMMIMVAAVCCANDTFLGANGGNLFAEQAHALKNEMLALNGFGFSDPVEYRYYNSRAWYHYNPRSDTALLLPYDKNCIAWLDSIAADWDKKHHEK